MDDFDSDFETRFICPNCKSVSTYCVDHNTFKCEDCSLIFDVDDCFPTSQVYLSPPDAALISPFPISDRDVFSDDIPF